MQIGLCDRRVDREVLRTATRPGPTDKGGQAADGRYETPEGGATTHRPGAVTGHRGATCARIEPVVPSYGTWSRSREQLCDINLGSSLGSSGFRQKAYEAGKLASATYTIDSLRDP